MTIGRIGQSEPIAPGREAGQVGRPAETNERDIISISKEGFERAELTRILNIVKGAPDVRADKVAEFKKKINDPNYITDVVINATADKLLQGL
ncbi:MAG: flagellar biosynthesis anti-sigma factor FlgM [Spirochaetaceae bacterium]|jgi:anti-sigma28 factor (negative regulator of flagellin synthesis)|nr:flagellar biosynthesis anti-sigma factor FlgM [Spirochaetaceae bacterium]